MLCRTLLRTRPRRVLPLAVAVVLLLVAWGGRGEHAASAQEPGASITVNQVDASSYPDLTAVVTVLDANGSTSPGLTAPAFSAQDGGTAIEVVDARRVVDTTLRLGVVLVIDVSGSMEGAPLAAAQEAATAFVRQLDPGDEAALLAFDDEVRVVVDFTQDKEALIAGVEGLVAVGDTALYDAVQTGAFAAGSSEAPRRAVVMLSDGEDTASIATDAASLDAARGARVPVFAIGLGGATDPAYLGELAAATGGRYFTASQADVAAVYAAIADQLRGQYVLTLRSPAAADGGDASLVVAADVDGQRVESAPASFVRGEAPPAPAPTASSSSEGGASDGGNAAVVALVLGAAAAVAVVGAVVVFALRRLDAGRKQRERERHAGRQSDAPLPGPLPSAPMQRAAERRARITGLTGEHAGTSFQFGSTPIVIGSDAEADVRLARSSEVAPRHAVLWVREGKIMLRHTGGVRQTLSAGRPVDWLILEEGDEFSIGPYQYRVEPASPNGSGPSAGTDASR